MTTQIPHSASARFLMTVADLRVSVRPLVGGFDAFAGSYGSWAEGHDLEAGIDIDIVVTSEMLAHERSMPSASSYSDVTLQTLAVYRRIADEGPRLGRFLMHAAVIEYDGKAYAFAAPSGTGKTTHLRLWKATFGDDATVLNGDKPLIRMLPAQNGGHVEFAAYGTPWCGKEGWNANSSAPLGGICLLERGDADECRKIKGAEALEQVMKQTHMPKDPSAAVATLSFLDALLREVPMYRLKCTMEKAAVRASFEAMVGRPFDDCRRDGSAYGI